MDFCAPNHKLVIELDGSQHLKQHDNDAARTDYLKSQGYRVLRFWNDAILKDMDGVGAAILEALKLA